MQTQILFKIDGFDVEVELDKNSEFCSALKIVDPDNWFVLEFQLRDVKVEEYAERVIWDHSRQQPRHAQVAQKTCHLFLTNGKYNGPRGAAV